MNAQQRLRAIKRTQEQIGECGKNMVTYYEKGDTEMYDIVCERLSYWKNFLDLLNEGSQS